MSDKTLYVLEQGKWESSIVLGVFGSLESVEERIAKGGGQRKEDAVPVKANETMYEIPGKQFEWYRVTAFEACWERVEGNS